MEPFVERHEVLGPSHERWSSPRSTLEIWCPQPHVVLVRAKGHGTLEHVRCIIEWRDRALSLAPRLVLFDDLSEVTGYDPDCRVRLTRWILNHRSQIDALHVLSHGKLAKMGVTVANLALGGMIQLHDSPKKFEAELQRASRR